MAHIHCVLLLREIKVKAPNNHVQADRVDLHPPEEDFGHQNSNKAMGVGTAILIGQLVVNLPVLVIIIILSTIGICFTAILITIIAELPSWFFHVGALISVTVGSSVAWIWWSYSVPRWRQWALKSGAPENKLQRWGVITGLVWPKGSLFEKTEFKVKD